MGTIVGRVIASDRDNAPFNMLRYELIGDSGAPVFFDVDSQGEKSGAAQCGIIIAYHHVVTRGHGHLRCFD